MSLTVLIMAKNEEQNIKDCLASVSFADEIIVIDDFSTDKTASIASEQGAKVYQHAMNGNWGEQYNYAISTVTSEWVMFVDADERVTPELKEEILEAVRKNEHCGYKMSYLNFAVGKPLYHGGWKSHSGLRLFPKGGVRYEGLVHPRIIHSLPLKKLNGYFLHYSYPTWEHYLNKLNSYTELAAKENYKRGKRANFFFDIVFRPFIAFFKMYIIKSGWRDGKVGFILAVFHYFYTMAKYVKLYSIQNKFGGYQ